MSNLLPDWIFLFLRSTGELPATGPSPSDTGWAAPTRCLFLSHSSLTVMALFITQSLPHLPCISSESGPVGCFFYRTVSCHVTHRGQLRFRTTPHRGAPGFRWTSRSACVRERRIWTETLSPFCSPLGFQIQLLPSLKSAIWRESAREKKLVCVYACVCILKHLKVTNTPLPRLAQKHVWIFFSLNKILL